MSLKPSDIYVGFWINRSEGHSILGTTITLPSDVGVFLVAFLALFVSLVATYLWNSLAFFIHYHRQHLTEGRCHPLLRQQQVIFKSGLPATSSLFRLGSLFWANRSASLSLKYSWLPILFAVSCAALTIISGLYSSRIFDSSSQIELLLRSPSCGAVRGTGADDEVQMFANQLSEIFGPANIYSQECYNATTGKNCDFFAARNIDWNTDWLAKCPFDESMCLGPAMQLDTGRINSNTILGINSPVQDQIDFRKITTCAPITQENYTMRPTNSATLKSFHDYDPDNECVVYTYGSSQGNRDSNVTTVYNAYVADRTSTRTLWSVTYYENDTSGAFSPIAELKIPNGDGVLLFISNNAIAFRGPCNDPVFGAHIEIKEGTGNEMLYYRSDHLAGIIGCSELYQICISSDDSSCSALGGIHGTIQAARNMSLMPSQRATAITLLDALVFTETGLVTFDPQHLLAQKRLLGSDQLLLPSNQWQIEIWGRHAATMAAVQYRLIQQRLVEHLFSPTLFTSITPEERAFCSGQRIRSGAVPGFTNVSGPAFFLIISLGTLIIAISLSLDRVMGIISPVKQGVWVKDNALHLQRLAYMNQERVGDSEISTWVDLDKDIPRIEGGGLLGPLVEPEFDKPPDQYRSGRQYVNLPQRDLDDMLS